MNNEVGNNYERTSNAKMKLKAGCGSFKQQVGRGDVFSSLHRACWRPKPTASRSSSSAARHFGSEVVGFGRGGGAFAKLPSDLEIPIFKAHHPFNQSFFFHFFHFFFTPPTPDHSDIITNTSCRRLSPSYKRASQSTIHSNCQQ